jgi:hypothetical protein
LEWNEKHLLILATIKTGVWTKEGSMGTVNSELIVEFVVASII